MQKQKAGGRKTSFLAFTIRLATVVVFLFALNTVARAQSTATLQGAVTDTSNAAVPGAKVVVHNQNTGVDRTTQTDESGAYLVSGLLPGVYRVEITASGFQTAVIKDLTLSVATTTTENTQLQVGQVSQEVTVTGGEPLVDTSDATVGQVINQRTVQQIPLNGRHFVDLGLLIPGTVTPPQNGFLTAPLRGQGSFAINTAGQREDTTNWMINGINLSDEVQNQITFQPSINTVSEFKIDNSTFPAEYGRNSGAIANILTRSGSNDFHGEVFDFVRNNFFDARNFFNPKPVAMSPFIRNNFGAAAGGPIKRNKAFFFASYEGLRQRQGLSLSSFTLSPDQQTQIAATSNSTIQKIAALFPTENAQGTGTAGVPGSFNGFNGSAVAPVNIDQGTGDLDFALTDNDHLHGYYALQQDLRQEPTLQGNNLPGWGDTRASRRQIMTLEEDHVFSPSLTNEARVGYNRIHITFTPNQLLNPTSFNINDGVTAPIGIPQISVTGLFNIGGPGGFPQGRGDTTVVGSDTVRYLRGNHSFVFGGEIRRFYNNNFALDAGTFTYGNICNFMADGVVTFTGGVPSSPCAGAPTGGTTTNNRFSINLSNGASKILEPAFGLYFEDSYKVRSNITLELGLRYDYNNVITDADNRFVEFIPSTVSLVQVGTNGLSEPYRANKKNIQPRVGIAWDPWGDGKTSVRAGYAILADQPVSGIVAPQASNPPFGDPLTFNGTIGLSNAQATAGPAGLSPSTIFAGFDDPYVQSYNLTIQHQVSTSLGFQVGYVGSKGTHLRLARNLNQPAIGTATVPFAALSASSPIRPGAGLGNITEIDSSGNSNYNALWVTANKRFATGLQFNASYTYSKSLDYNSLSSQGVTLEDSTNPRLNYGPSDFDARHRFVINAIYDLPFKGNHLVSGWELGLISQAQSGNPLTIVFNNTTATGNRTLRPDASAAIQTTGNPANWIANPSVLSSPSTGGVFHFGNLGRNTVIGPTFVNTDFSLIKNTKITERFNTEFRAEVFDIFNHPNFGNPNLVFGTSTFGLINSTRFPTGDFGSSRQIQLALKLEF
ncbi:MAG TPA: carboxypeptidase regulatory-like domain-containing protein [Candidatus Angelobacter sp.]|nr:carboxypeptidase regulatory-like domain-containing protein [Candidatus Angelobacter sp.]